MQRVFPWFGTFHTFWVSAFINPGLFLGAVGEETSRVVCKGTEAGFPFSSPGLSRSSYVLKSELVPFSFQQNKAKKKKKGVVPGGGLKATMKDDLEDYGGYDGGYVQDFEDFMWPVLSVCWFAQTPLTSTTPFLSNSAKCNNQKVQYLCAVGYPVTTWHIGIPVLMPRE